jgi:hypothetical protein
MKNNELRIKNELETVFEALSKIRASFYELNQPTDKNYEDYKEAERLFDNTGKALDTLVTFFSEGDRL